MSQHGLNLVDSEPAIGCREFDLSPALSAMSLLPSDVPALLIPSQAPSQIIHHRAPSLDFSHPLVGKEPPQGAAFPGSRITINPLSNNSPITSSRAFKEAPKTSRVSLRRSLSVSEGSALITHSVPVAQIEAFFPSVSVKDFSDHFQMQKFKINETFDGFDIELEVA
jgi:hypothetical protein